ncbi:helix-turn-helix domain-containing protein [Halobacillus litoralis]|uniref:helix-turn-helix domain-containing protein n=1 Tax=Halobacillus litoralis TaxID=45668 RepID=UPI001CD31C11|nr:helix-turn-helix transcriptional regulator [Halobacillus litoralis]MCA1021621.1 helix-turn-helix transcriptional regulator [Halobacillus litoralis]
MVNQITVTISDKNLSRIQELVDLENSISKWTKNKWRERSVEDFIKGAIYQRIEMFDNFDEFYEVFSKGRTNYKNNFKCLTEEISMTQADVASITGINPSTINQIFNNHSQPRMDYFFKIWITLGCPPLYKCLTKETGKNV